MAVVAVAAVLSTLLYAGVGALVGDTAARHVGIVNLLLTATVYDLLLAPFTVPWIMKLARRLEHDPMAGDTLGGTARTTPYRWVSPSGRSSSTSQRGSLLKGIKKL
jgi:hypothetical protein